MTPSPWTPERDAELTRLWMDGLSSRRIGAILGCTSNSVIGRARRIGLPKRQSPIIPSVDWTHELVERCKQAVDCGLSWREAAQLTGVSDNALRKLALRRGWVKEPAPPINTQKGPTMPAEREAPPRPTNRPPVDPDGPSGRWDGPGPETCRYLTGEPRDMNYCPEKPLPGKAWCSKCLQVVYYSAGKDKRIRVPA